MPEKEALDKPDAADAGNTLQFECQAGGSAGSGGGEIGEPAVIALLEDEGFDREECGGAEIVEALEAVLEDELVDKLTAGTAKFPPGRGRGERSAAVDAEDLFHTRRPDGGRAGNGQ